MRTLLGLTLWSVVVLSVRLAAAEEPPTSMFVQHPTAVLAVLANFGSPTGHLGVEIDHSLLRWVAVNAGFGAGGAGPQGAAGVRLRVPMDDRWAVGTGASMSYGKYKGFCLSPECSSPAGKVVWANLEGAVDARFHSRVALRIALGFSIDQACSGPSCGSQSPSSRALGNGLHPLPYLSVGVGYGW